MKIKTKKQLNLPQLIEWAWNNPDLSNGTSFLSNGSESVKIEFRFNPRGVLNLDVLNGGNISNDIRFNLEEYEEIEITEDTVIPKLVEIYNIIDKRERITIHENSNIYSNVDSQDPSDFKSFAFYILNDDYTMTLIWTHDKGLVE